MIRTNNLLLNQLLGPVSLKSRNFFGRISGDIILLVSSKRRRLEAQNLAVILIFHSLTTYQKKQLYRISGSEFYEWLVGPEKFAGLSRNGPLNRFSVGKKLLL